MNLLKKLSMEQLMHKANTIRKDIVDVCVKNGAGHIAPSLSCVDILTTLYYNVMNVGKDPKWEDRDRLIFSKAHGCYGLYSILSDISYVDRKKDWESFYIGESCLSGCAERIVDKGIEASCGSLGHGLPVAVGIAYGAKLKNKKFRIYCIVGDGEMQEGSNWEAIQFAVKYKLSNLTVIIDANRLQAMDFLKDVLTPSDRENDLEIKMKAFGFETKSCNGHNISELISALDPWSKLNSIDGAPQALIANTIKGYGLYCMENIPKFHFRLPTAEELRKGCRYE